MKRKTSYNDNLSYNIVLNLPVFIFILTQRGFTVNQIIDKSAKIVEFEAKSAL